MTILKRLDTNKLYHTGSLVLDCWVGPAEHLGSGDDYSCWSYFGPDGRYLGPDQYGIEPIFTADSIKISLIATVLLAAGERFAGNNVTEVATDWFDHDFDTDSVSDWCDIGVWNPSVAAEWRGAGLTPQIVAAAAEVLIESLPDGSDPCDTYTDGCPIYACCNDDYDPGVIVMCCREVMREFGEMTLREWSHGQEHVMVFVAGVGHPTGTVQPYGHPDMDWLDRIGIDQLSGTTDEQGRWQWDGEGDPRDDHGNSITKVTAYVSREQWEFAVSEYMEC